MSEQLPSRMSVELSLAGGEPVEVYDRAIGPNPADVFPADVLSRFDALPSVLRGFLTALARDRLDADTILVFADWLEEHGRTAEGQRVRLLRPRPGDVLVLLPQDQHPIEVQRQALADRAGELADALGLCWVGLPSPEFDIRLADPEQLRAAGWVREEEAVERVRAEREACAVTAETSAVLQGDQYACYAAPSPDGQQIASAIRHRGDSA